MNRYEVNTLAALEDGTLKGYQLINRVRETMALEGAPILPRIQDHRAVLLTLQHGGEINCPHADRPVFSPFCTYRLTDAGLVALEAARARPA